MANSRTKKCGTITKVRKVFGRNQRALAGYRKLRENTSIDPALVLLEPQQGRTADGNVFYIAKELASNTDYANLSLYLVVNEASKARTESLLKSHDMGNISIVIINSPEYINLLATAKYLITDTGFPTYYVKKPGQVVWNTWHGTPLKAMGRSDSSAAHDLGNMQRNFVMADFLSYPNDYTRKHMIKDYMLENIAHSKTAVFGYPRNDAFFDKASVEKTKRRLGDKGQKLYAYMPTWRPKQDGIPARFAGTETMHYLTLIDGLLEDDEVMYVNIHPLARKKVHFKAFKHVKPFPEELETYEILACCDALVTDYSSVMFDFACTHRKIVLFDYDEHLYLRNRGLYTPLGDLPFPHTKTVDNLITELRTPKEYDDLEFHAKFCNHESGHASADLCRSVLYDKGDVSWEPIPDNGKEKILIHTGNLAQNGITSSLSALLSALDTGEKNYLLTFSSRAVAKNKRWLDTVPSSVTYIPRKGTKTLSYKERVCLWLYKRRLLPFKNYQAGMKDAYEAEFKRNYQDIKFDHVVQFSGYGYEIIMEFAQCGIPATIYAHNDMEMEFKTKGNTRLDVLKYAYQTYKNVAVVSEDIEPVVKRIADGNCKTIVVPNCFDRQRIREKSILPITFDDTTESEITESKLRSFVSSGNAIISIGRFSPEKQHDLLLDAFEEVWESNHNAKLVIVGGVSTGDTYQKTVEHARSLRCRDNVALILSMSNPYPVLAACKGLILSSKYEGLGLVLLEALALDKPVVSTDVQGPRGFMQEHGGMLVENSQEGIRQGLEALIANSIAPLDVDFDKLNEQSTKAFLLAID